jgi:hypothetical protein
MDDPKRLPLHAKTITVQPRTSRRVEVLPEEDEESDYIEDEDLSEEDSGWIEQVWDRAHAENESRNRILALADEQIVHEGPISPQFDRQRLSTIAKPFVVGARIFAGALMLLLWFCIVGPIWFAILLRTISSFSIATVTAMFTGASAPDVKRLDAVAELWGNGFRKIVTHIMQSEPVPTAYVPIMPLQAFTEVFFAVLLYTGVFSTLWTLTHFQPLSLAQCQYLLWLWSK